MVGSVLLAWDTIPTSEHRAEGSRPDSRRNDCIFLLRILGVWTTFRLEMRLPDVFVLYDRWRYQPIGSGL